MASPPTTRARLAHDASSSSDTIPVDVLFDILQLLPAKDLCRLQTVCRSWHSITSDAGFLKAHADRHKEPHFLAKFRDDDTHVYVVDLSGNVVKRIAGGGGGHQVLRTRLNLACLATEWNTCRVLNPATGGIQQVPRVIQRNHRTFFALGLVASTGQYKLLCCLSAINPCVFVGRQQLSGRVQVLTINGGTDHSQWRPRPGPSLAIDVRSGVVVDGVVYFLRSADYILPLDVAPSNMALYYADHFFLRERSGGEISVGLQGLATLRQGRW